VNKYQERTVYISSGILVLFSALSWMTTDWGFFLWSLIPAFLNIMFAFFATENKYKQRFNQRHAKKLKPQ